MPFAPEDLALIDATEEMHIETRATGRVYRTIIWVVVDGDEVFVRSYQGERGHWYQRALSDEAVALHVGGRRIPARAVPAVDADSVSRTSEGFRRKYPRSRSTDAMVRPEVLATTLRLEPDVPDLQA